MQTLFMANEMRSMWAKLNQAGHYSLKALFDEKAET